MRTDRLTAMTKLIDAFPNFAKGPKNQKIQKNNKRLIKYTLQLIRPTLVLRSSCFLEQVVVYQKGVNKKKHAPVRRKDLA
jgi:hypothetical protein